MTELESNDHPACANCSEPALGHYCAFCGQRTNVHAKSLWALSGDLGEELLRPDSRLLRTMQTLLFKPGRLTTEYFAGRQIRYTPPLRLYLVISFLFFFLMPGINPIETNIKESDADIELQTDLDNLEFSGIKIPGLSAAQQQQLDATIEVQIKKVVTLVRENPGELYGQMIDSLSAVMFFMLPLFAGFLKLLYLRQGVFYIEHLLLAVHNHCLLFFAMLSSGLIDLVPILRTELFGLSASDLIELWVPVYIYLSMKHVYGQSHWRTSIKFLIGLVAYLTVTILGGTAAVIIGVFTV